MDTHNNARLTPRGREDMVRAVVDRGLSKAEAARQFNTTPKTVAKWVARFRELGVEGLRDRSSRPHSLPSQTPRATADAVEVLRRDRHIQGHIAAKLGLSTATVSRICTARGLGRLDAIEPKQPRPRYERDAPGELVHIDIKKLGKFYKPGHRVTGHFPGYRRSDGAGHEFAHVAVDDHSRIACIDILPDENKRSAVLFLERTVAYFLSIGVRIDRVMTDNGSCYRSTAFAEACRRLGIKHIMTRPYTPQTNGKVERFIQTALREWAYATEYQNSKQRRAKLLTCGYARGYAFAVAGLTGLVEPAASLLGAYAVSLSQLVLPWALTFAVGAMVYVISHEIIPETHRHGFENQATLGLTIGLAVMMFLDVAFASP